jgi:hypothetical protein
MRKDHPNGPPPGWSKESKSAWPSLPAEVREAVLQSEQEANDYFAQFAGLKEFRDSAAERGTTLEAQLAEWTRIEDVLRADLASGILFVSRRLAKELGIPNRHFARWAGELYASIAHSIAHAVPRTEH